MKKISIFFYLFMLFNAQAKGMNQNGPFLPPSQKPCSLHPAQSIQPLQQLNNGGGNQEEDRQRQLFEEGMEYYKGTHPKAPGMTEEARFKKAFDNFQASQCPRGERSIGLMYLEGNAPGSKEMTRQARFKIAFSIAKKLHQNGDIPSTYILYIFYKHRNGVTTEISDDKRLVRSMRLLIRASNAGHKEATEELKKRSQDYIDYKRLYQTYLPTYGEFLDELLLGKPVFIDDEFFVTFSKKSSPDAFAHHCHAAKEFYPTLLKQKVILAGNGGFKSIDSLKKKDMIDDVPGELEEPNKWQGTIIIVPLPPFNGYEDTNYSLILFKKSTDS